MIHQSVFTRLIHNNNGQSDEYPLDSKRVTFHSCSHFPGRKKTLYIKFHDIILVLRACLKYSTTIIACLLAILIPVFALCNDQKTPSFSEIVTSTSDSHLLFFAKVDNAFTQEMNDGLKSGVPIQFSFYLELREKKLGKVEQTLVTRKFQRTLSYDTLKETYLVEFDETRGPGLSFPSLKDAQQAMCEINGLKLLEINKLKSNTIYEARIRAHLYRRTLPKGLHGIEPLLALWNIETEWQGVEFTINQQQ